MMTTEPASHAALADAGELEHHRAALVRHCRRMLGSSAEADDAVQETMMRAWRARDRFEDGTSLSTWLYHIATNVCFDALRRRRRHAVVVALRRLPPTQRVAVILHDVFRWKANEVAALLDTSAPAVNSALQRARATLRAGALVAPAAVDGEQRRHLDHLVDAFARRDVARLVTLVRDDTVAA